MPVLHEQKLNPLTLYAITTIAFAIPWPTLWYFNSLSTVKMVVLLFCFDIVLTIEAALYSDVILIAVLHVITVPAFFGLIYFDLMQEQKKTFRCFVCGKNIEEDEDVDTVRRSLEGRRKNVLVHSSCVNLGGNDRKAFSEKLFKKGIPK
ncbi:MAG: hypothetical protein ACRDF4_11560 [Rhabdochlamydiaceae bacterium]